MLFLTLIPKMLVFSKRYETCIIGMCNNSDHKPIKKLIRLCSSCHVFACKHCITMMINSIVAGTVSNSIYKCSLCSMPNHKLIRDSYKLSFFSKIRKDNKYQTYQIINNICNDIDENTQTIDAKNYKIGHCVNGKQCYGKRYSLMPANQTALQCGETDKDEVITNFTCIQCSNVPKISQSFGMQNVKNYFDNKKEHTESIISSFEPGTRIRFHNCGMGMVITEGCFHICCKKCKKHFCWVCLATFNTATECIEHIDIQRALSRNIPILNPYLIIHYENTIPHYGNYIKANTPLLNTEFDIIVPQPINPTNKNGTVELILI